MDNNLTADKILLDISAQLMVDTDNIAKILQQTIKPKKAPAGLAERILNATVFNDAAQ